MNRDYLKNLGLEQEVIDGIMAEHGKAIQSGKPSDYDELKTKSETLDMAVDLMVKSEKISDREAYRKQVYLREEESTTGIGEGIAIPHGKCDAVKKPGLAAMVIKMAWNLRHWTMSR